MKSGKTTELLRRLSRYGSIGYRILYTTTEELKLSRGLSPNFAYDIKHTNDLREIDTSRYDAIGIDEAQFYGDLSIILVWVSEGKHVLVSSLNGDYKQQRFGNALDLIPMAEDITLKRAYCVFCAKDGKIVEAPFSKRLVDVSSQVYIPATDTDYEPVCRKHLQ